MLAGWAAPGPPVNQPVRLRDVRVAGESTCALERREESTCALERREGPKPLELGLADARRIESRVGYCEPG